MVVRHGSCTWFLRLDVLPPEISIWKSTSTGGRFTEQIPLKSWNLLFEAICWDSSHRRKWTLNFDAEYFFLGDDEHPEPQEVIRLLSRGGNPSQSSQETY